MARSIFIGPAKYPEDGPANLQIRLNQELAQAYADYPLAATYFPLENIGLTAEGTSGAVDSLAEVQRKLGGALTALSLATGQQVPQPVPTLAPYGGLTAPLASSINAYLLALRAPPPDALLGYTLALDFKNGVYRSGDYVTTDVTTLPGYSFSRAGPKYELDTTGRAVYFGPNTPGIVPGVGFWARQNHNNFALNNTMAGSVAGTPGTLPTGWGNGMPAWLTRSISSGQDPVTGFLFIDLRYVGTNPDTTNGYYPTIIFTGNVNNSVNTWWSANVRAAVVAGSISGLNAPPRLTLAGVTAAGAFVEGITANIPVQATPTLLSVTKQMVNASTTQVRGYIDLYINPGATVDYTIRLNLPHMFAAPYLGPVVATSGAAVSTGNDRLNFNQPIPGDEDWIMAIVVNFPHVNATGGNSERPLAVNDGSAVNRVNLARETNAVTIGGAQSGSGFGGYGAGSTQVASGRFVLLGRRAAGRFTAAVKSPAGAVSVGTSYAIPYPVGFNTIEIGKALDNLYANAPVELVIFRRGTFTDSMVLALLQGL